MAMLGGGWWCTVQPQFPHLQSGGWGGTGLGEPQMDRLGPEQTPARQGTREAEPPLPRAASPRGPPGRPRGAERRGRARAADCHGLGGGIQGPAGWLPLRLLRPGGGQGVVR